jgi:hypothetical protein
LFSTLHGLLTSVGFLQFWVGWNWIVVDRATNNYFRRLRSAADCVRFLKTQDCWLGQSKSLIPKAIEVKRIENSCAIKTDFDECKWAFKEMERSADTRFWPQRTGKVSSSSRWSPTPPQLDSKEKRASRQQSLLTGCRYPGTNLGQ